MTQVHHLACTGSDDNVTVAMIGGNEMFVCHCTHVDGEIDPVMIHGFEELADRWEWVTN